MPKDLVLSWGGAGPSVGSFGVMWQGLGKAQSRLGVREGCLGAVASGETPGMSGCADAEVEGHRRTSGQSCPLPGG